MNSTLIDNESNLVNDKSLTNIGVLEFMQNYILSNINIEMTHMVRDLLKGCR
jgi:miniconductance mechanosensitive channel